MRQNPGSDFSQFSIQHQPGHGYYWSSAEGQAFGGYFATREQTQDDAIEHFLAGARAAHAARLASLYYALGGADRIHFGGSLV